MSDAGIVFPDRRTRIRFKPGERVRYVENRRSFGAFMRSDQMRDVTERAAGHIAVRAAALSPKQQKKRGDGDKTTGWHARVAKGYRVRRNAGLMMVGGNARVKVEVVNNVEGSALIEFGGRGQPRVRALGHAGGEVGEFKGKGGGGLR